MRYNANTYWLEDTARLKRVPLMLFIIGLAGSGSFAATHPEQFFHSYLTAYLFWIGPALGGLFFTMIHHLTGSVWSVTVRRIAESLASTIPIMALLFVPILLGMHDLFEWSHPEAVADPILLGKSPFLNPTFFTIRAVIYFAVWSFLAWRLWTLSDRQDGGATPEIRSGLLKVSALGMILFALTISFAAFDWMMSLQPHWYSTIYGVYFAMGSVMSAIAVMILVTARLQKWGALTEEITAEHRHDLGKIFFTFIILWAYMAFSQYFLIWYANLPEETVFYHARWIGSWKAVSLLIVFGHFVIPFFALISRPAKRSLVVLPIIAVWMLVMHWVDLYWNVMPGFHKEGAHISPSDITAMVLIGSLFLGRFWTHLSSRPLIPVGDPKLSDSIHHVSH